MHGAEVNVMALCAFGVPLKDAGGRLGLAPWWELMVDKLDYMMIMVFCIIYIYTHVFVCIYIYVYNMLFWKLNDGMWNLSECLKSVV